MSTIKSDAITAATGTNTNLALTGKGTGKVALGDGALTFPDSDGSANQPIITDGSAGLSFSTLPIAGGGTGSTSTTYCSLTANVTGTLPIANGGTNSTSTTYCDLTANVTGTMPVANGGTGAVTHTANNVLTGNGTSAFSSVAPSTSGNVLTSDGSAWTSAAAPGGGEVANHTNYVNTTRTAVSDSNSGTLWTVSFNKLASGTDLVITGTMYSYGNGGSGTTCATVTYGSGTEYHGGVSLMQRSAGDWTAGFAINMYITGHTTTGAQDLVIGWDYGNGTSSKPWATTNPSSTDNAAVSTMNSFLTIMEVTT